MSLADTMIDRPQICLVARDDARNIHRRYRIEQSTDLFGFHVVDLAWGRIGALGQAKRLSFVDAHEARRFVRQLLLRRQSAVRRLGTAYRPIA